MSKAPTIVPAKPQALRRFAPRFFFIALTVGFLIATPLTLIGCGDPRSRNSAVEVSFTAPDGTERGEFALEVANTEPLRQRGLMFRDSLSRTGGMLFIFDEEEPRAFWMKNTKIPLDMIFISSEKKVQGILPGVPPMNEEPRAVPGVASRYVVELASGVAAERGIAVGDVVAW